MTAPPSTFYTVFYRNSPDRHAPTGWYQWPTDYPITAREHVAEVVIEACAFAGYRPTAEKLCVWAIRDGRAVNITDIAADWATETLEEAGALT